MRLNVTNVRDKDVSERSKSEESVFNTHTHTSKLCAFKVLSIKARNLLCY